MLVQSDTAAACFRVKRTREVDVHARNLDAWDQDYVQTSPGVFQGQVRELFDGPLQAFEEVADSLVIDLEYLGRESFMALFVVPRAPHALTDALKKRLLDHAATDNIRYTQVIVNHGREAGASLAHPHGQLLGLPFVPGEILDEERAFVRFEGGCILCATVEAELVSSERVLFATDDAVAICPWWSGGPYEILIIPRHHDLHLPDASDEQLAGVGRAIRESLVHLNNLFDDVSFNLVFHTAPHHHNGAFHWHIHLFPKLTTVAGFERGTGVMINIVPPEQAAIRSIRPSPELLRGVGSGHGAMERHGQENAY